MSRVFWMFSICLASYVSVTTAGELVIGIHADQVSGGALPSWESVFEKRGFIRHQSSVFKGSILARKAEKDELMFLSSRVVTNAPSDRHWVIEVVDGRKGETVLCETLSVTADGTSQATNWMTRLAAQAEEAMTEDKHKSSAVAIGFSSDAAARGAGGVLYAVFKKRILGEDSIVFLNRDLLPDVHSLQDHFLIDGWKKDNRIHGLLYPADVLCRVQSEKRTGLRFHVCSPDDAMSIGQVRVSSANEIEKAITELRTLVSSPGKGP